MSKIVSKSPERHTFQKEKYIERQTENNNPISQDYLDLFANILEQDKNKFSDPENCKNNLEYDLLTTDWILEKVRVSDTYAQNLYAAMCNMRFVKKDLFPYLRQDPDKDLCSYSWRYTGGIIADMQQKGDYIDWYCSGIRDFRGYDPDLEVACPNGYVPEGQVTEEIEADLLKLGWIPVEWNDD